ncbi:MAG TPA: hypothetical protein VEB19_14500 [Gemmatimonadaceae bacterium]|nr:hypothetical protein [Gemmatimonadaceae bacterium]
MTSRVWWMLLGMLSLACTGAEPPRDDGGVPASTRADTGRTQRVDSARAWAVPPSAHNVTCEPATVSAEDTLTIRMTRPHGKSFHVLAPDGTPYIVVFHGEGQADRGQRRSLVPPDSFGKLTEITLNTKSARAGVWVFGRDTNEALFRAPGTYRLIVGDDLETDGPVYAECLVTFRP